jgi:hypothetical protein
MQVFQILVFFLVHEDEIKGTDLIQEGTSIVYTLC